MNFKKTLIALTLVSFASVPALAAKKQTFTCESTVDANGNVTYLPVKPAKTAMKKKAVHRRLAKAPAKRVYREETKTVTAAPVVVEPAPEYTPAPVVVEKEKSWMEKHAVQGPVYGNMSGWAGRSTLSYLHGTDNPLSSVAFNSDEGPSAEKYRNTATDVNEDF